MKYLFKLIIAVLVPLGINAQSDIPVEVTSDKGFSLHGSLLRAEGDRADIFVLMISGSGPTDRDGNNPLMDQNDPQKQNNSLKMLATGLYQAGYSSLRYDKRGIAQSRVRDIKEEDMRFEHGVEDALAWAYLLKSKHRADQIIIAGHSEGSLVGMLAAQDDMIDGYISIAGIGQRADQIILQQLGAQSKQLQEQATPVLDSLVAGHEVAQPPLMLYSLFRPSVQPYMISWLKYQPRVEIARLNKPTMIIQGTTDLQVPIEEAEMLHDAAPTATILYVNGMNHILKAAPADRIANMKTYTDSSLPLHPDLMPAVLDFLNKL